MFNGIKNLVECANCIRKGGDWVENWPLNFLRKKVSDFDGEKKTDRSKQDRKRGRK